MSNLSPKTILHGRDAIFRVRVKSLIFNMIMQLWADVKYHVPTGFGFSPKASVFYVFVSVPPGIYSLFRRMCGEIPLAVVYFRRVRRCFSASMMSEPL